MNKIRQERYLNMKKTTIALQISAILALTGCSSDVSSDNESGGMMNDASLVFTENGSNELAQENLADKIEKLAQEFFDNYYNGTMEADFDKCFKNFPDFYLEMLEKEVETCGENHQQYIDGVRQNYVDTYGDDFKISHRISVDESGTKGILKLSDDSVESMKEIFKETYGKDVNLEEAYTVYITTAVQGSLDSYSEEREWYILKIDGEFYLYEDYYEKYMLDEQ